jgi:hypothetical protein
MAMTAMEFTTGVATETRNMKLEVWNTRRLTWGFCLFVTGAGENGEARIFWIGRIGGGTLAEQEF